MKRAVVRHKLLRRILIVFCCGNEELYLKNVSLIKRDRKTVLSQSYDLLKSTIVLAHPREEMVRPIAGKR